MIISDSRLCNSNIGGLSIANIPDLSSTIHRLGIKLHIEQLHFGSDGAARSTQEEKLHAPVARETRHVPNRWQGTYDAACYLEPY